MLDLRIAHEHFFGSSSDPSLNRHLHYIIETCKSLSFGFQSFITPTLVYKSFIWLSLYRFIMINLHYPNDLDRSLNEGTVDKIRKYHTDYGNNPPNPISSMSAITSTSLRFKYTVNLCSFYSHRLIGKLTAFLHLQEFSFRYRPVDCSQIHFRRATFSSQLKSRVGNILVKGADLRVNLNLDGTPFISKSHTHPSHFIYSGDYIVSELGPQ